MVRFTSFVAVAVIAGCGSDSPPASPQPTTSGGLATITAGDRVIGFVPHGSTVTIITLDGNTGSASALLPLDPAAATVAISFDVDSCAADPKSNQVICVGYDSSKVAILDIADFIASLASGDTPSAGEIAEREIDLGNAATGSFSGGDCINCGVLADSDDARFIVSSGDGIRVLDYAGNMTDSYLSDATHSFTTENFGFDAGRNLVISPEYETDTEYVWVIALDKHRAYRWNHKMVSASYDPSGLVGYSGLMIADSASIDPATGIVTIGDEFTDTLLAINLSDAAFDDATGTFVDESYSIVALEQVASGGLLTTGQAIDPANHMLFLEEEFADGIGVVSLPDRKLGGPMAMPVYTSAYVPNASASCPGVSTWHNVGDPHGLALFTGAVDGREKGLLINTARSCMAVVDLEAFAAAPKVPGTNRIDALDDIIRFVSIATVP